MDEYINRNMFLKLISHKPSCPTTDREDRLIDGFISAVKNFPAADVRPVVLCRDCVHARRYTNKIKCGYWSEQTASEIVCEDDFCSYGEKRKES